MKCSVELPTAYLQYSDCFDFDFVIASTCLEHPDYKQYFMNTNRMMILDNGAFETGEAISDEDYISLARELQPDILIIPDVYQNNAATGSRAINFLAKWKESPIEGTELMGVLQGTTRDQIMGLYSVIYKPAGVKYYGLGYGTGLDRFQFLQAHPEIENVHILGLPVLTEAIGLATLPNVISIDSSLPVKATKEGTYLTTALHASTYAQPDDTTLNPALLVSNLKAFQQLCNGSFDLTVALETEEVNNGDNENAAKAKKQIEDLENGARS